MKAKSIIALIAIWLISAFAFADEPVKFFNYNGENGWYYTFWSEYNYIPETTEAKLAEYPPVTRLTRFDDYAIRKALSDYFCEEGDLVAIAIAKYISILPTAVTRLHLYIVKVKHPSEYDSYIEYDLIRGVDATELYHKETSQEK